MSYLCLKHLGSKVAAMGVCKGKSIVLHIVAVSALDLSDLVAAAGYHGNHIDPEDVLHAGAGDGAAVCLCKGIETVDLSCRGGPGIDCLLTGSLLECI